MDFTLKITDFFVKVDAVMPTAFTRITAQIENIGVRLKTLDFQKLLTKGDHYCEVVLELKD